mmetsp:Transcript_19571/g.50162  ORF Transcript_19571/g.50162 Transcript_19571/m.50162 type:complete len:448 (-) Transcript_19571:114-1457(-)
MGAIAVCCAVVVISILSVAEAKTFFFDDFSYSENQHMWRRWTKSELPTSKRGAFKLSAGMYHREGDRAATGLQTVGDGGRYFGISSVLDKQVESVDEVEDDIILQYTVKNEVDVQCGGSYVKLFEKGIERHKLDTNSPFLIMFGPDYCGPSSAQLKILLSLPRLGAGGGEGGGGEENGKGEVEKDGDGSDSRELYSFSDIIEYPLDEFSHTYTLVIKRGGEEFELHVDGERRIKGRIADYFDVPRQVPAGTPTSIEDPTAVKPSEWDEDMDGVWEAPLIDNPILNDRSYGTPLVGPFTFKQAGAIGFELFQLRAGTVFDDVILTSDYARVHELTRKGAVQRASEREAFRRFHQMAKVMEREERGRRSEGRGREEEEREGGASEGRDSEEEGGKGKVRMDKDGEGHLRDRVGQFLSYSFEYFDDDEAEVEGADYEYFDEVTGVWSKTR